MEYNVEKYREVLNAPGLQTNEDLQAVQKSLEEFRKLSLIWQEVFNYQPYQGLCSNTIESYIVGLEKVLKMRTK